ncbi:MAG: LysE family translocator [Aeromicrobium sp.]
MFTIGRALAYGRVVALATVVGNSLGLLVIVALVALGLGVVVQESIEVFTVLKVLGAAYLVWLGVQAIRHRHDFRVDGLRRGFRAAGGFGHGPADRLDHPGVAPGLRRGRHQPEGVHDPRCGAAAARQSRRGPRADAGAAAGLLEFTIGLLSDSLWAVIASQLRTWFARSRRRGEAVGTVGGLSMIGLGVGLVAAGEPR